MLRINNNLFFYKHVIKKTLFWAFFQLILVCFKNIFALSNFEFTKPNIFGEYRELSLSRTRKGPGNLFEIEKVGDRENVAKKFKKDFRKKED